MKNPLSLLAAMILLSSSGLALAAHGKAGLWRVSTTMGGMTMQMPPEAMAQMKAMNMKMPDSQTIVSQMCMTQAEVDADKPPAMDKGNEHCTTNVTSKSASSMTADSVCTGQMQGTGHVQISYTGDTQYAGSYSFKGTSEGHPVSMSSSFKGEWLKADCGAVKPAQ
jgi:Protein of unknown function (DUF3617)